MKRALLLSLLLFPSILSAQSVLGIKFGSSYETVKAQLEKRFGRYKVSEDEGCLNMYGLRIGEIYFTFGTFNFQYDGDKSYFNSANFSLPADKNEVEDMKYMRDYLYSQLKEKYKDEYLEEFTNEEGFKCYKFGINPLDSSKVLGIISLQRMKSNDGETRLYLNLDYLPIYYIDKSADF